MAAKKKGGRGKVLARKAAKKGGRPSGGRSTKSSVSG